MIFYAYEQSFMKTIYNNEYISHEYTNHQTYHHFWTYACV